MIMNADGATSVIVSLISSALRVARISGMVGSFIVGLPAVVEGSTVPINQRFQFARTNITDV